MFVSYFGACLLTFYVLEPASCPTEIEEPARRGVVPDVRKCASVSDRGWLSPPI